MTGRTTWGIGYKIVEAYYNKMEDKKAAIDKILNIKDYEAFTRESGYLHEFMKKGSSGGIH